MGLIRAILSICISYLIITILLKNKYVLAVPFLYEYLKNPVYKGYILLILVTLINIIF